MTFETRYKMKRDTLPVVNSFVEFCTTVVTHMLLYNLMREISFIGKSLAEHRSSAHP